MKPVAVPADLLRKPRAPWKLAAAVAFACGVIVGALVVGAATWWLWGAP